MSAKDTSAALPPKVKVRAYITSTPFWWGKGYNRNRICYLSGIPNSYPEWGGPARIDASIVNVIKFMNDAGLQTNYCCSARLCDHSRAFSVVPWKDAYVSFVDELPESYIAMLPEGVRVEPSNSGVKRIIRFKECDGIGLAKTWKQLERVTLRWWGIQEGY